jgi:mannose-6-phosphate isomerase-like protein (cupin superfamily)
MEHVTRQNAKKCANSAHCTAYEYETKNPGINMCVAEINGRYPEEGYAINHQCAEMGYILKGMGKLVTEHQVAELVEGDVILIPPGEKYYWEGILTLVISASPAWHPGQHEHTISSGTFQQMEID